jgi:pimeloyl-ACP methyl ester carboxylesterase
MLHLLVDELDAPLVTMPDLTDVREMAAAVRETVAAVERPRVVVGASLGAMVALECARLGEADGLVLISAGFGIEVADDVLEWVASNPPDLLAKNARIGLADRDNDELAAIREEDFAARGPAVLLHHLQALATYRPEPLPAPPPTIVLWGERDRGVPLAGHAELAMRCAGVLVPIAGAGHAPFLEQPAETVRWARWLGGHVAAGTFPELISSQS